jgi:transposase-like protein
MVDEAIAESGERVGAVTRVARQLGIGPESLCDWVKQADIDKGKHPGVRPSSSGGSANWNVKIARCGVPMRC